MKNILILGSSGSIGENALDIARRLPGEIQVAGLAANRNYQRLLEQAEEFGVNHIAVADPESAAACERKAPAHITVHKGTSGLCELVSMHPSALVLSAVVGMAGLPAVLTAVKQGSDVALATKEVLVAAGEMVTAECARTGARLLPVDSEHNAILQCLTPEQAWCLHYDNKPFNPPPVRRLLLTASGGPFAGKKDIDLSKVTVAEALNHPNWSMGRKVTIDSATLINKGLEIIEAHWLFGIPFDRIDVIIHPESIVHSMVEFSDNSILAQMSIPDMRFAIQYALLYPHRCPSELPRLDLSNLGSLTFMPPDEERFPGLRIARAAAEYGGTAPAVMNAANEVAVERFLDGEIAFSSIWQLIENTLEAIESRGHPSLEEIVAADQKAREYCHQCVTT